MKKKKLNRCAYDPFKNKWYFTDDTGYAFAMGRMRLWQQGKEIEYMNKMSQVLREISKNNKHWWEFWK